MVKRLWVDDLRNPPTSDYVIARTYDEAIHQLTTERFDEIYLDHDLADFLNGRERTGFDVVYWLCMRKQIERKYVPERYFMLTANPVGRQRMLNLIERYLT